ncbi:hypothetical protein AMTRI_Chr01g110070 [Amborella trichopoda]
MMLSLTPSNCTRMGALSLSKTSFLSHGPFPCKLSATSRREFADRPLLFASRKDLNQFIISSLKSENRKGQPSRRNTGNDEVGKDKEQSSDGDLSDSSSQEEIIALFRRIQSSISKGSPRSTNKSITDDSKIKQSADSVLHALRQYPARKLNKEATSGQGKDVRGRGALRRGSLNKDQKDEEPKTDHFKLSRPASNFVKRSPIPSSLPREKVDEKALASGAKTVDNALTSKTMDDMKLMELRKLARSHGMKGYSKLKKGELLALMKKELLQ